MRRTHGDGARFRGRLRVRLQGWAASDVCAAVTRAILPLVALLAFNSGCTKANDAPPAPTKPTPSEQGASPTPPPEPPAPDIARPPVDAACDSLSRAQCLVSMHCTLELVDHNVYRCRDDVGLCEIGVQQNSKTSCEAKAECAFDPGGCYCHCEGAARTEKVTEKPSGCACGCGGGKPPMCLPAK